MELTLASWNVHSGIGTDGRFDLSRSVAVLREIAPDVVALQEVGDFRGRTSHEAHLEHLAEQLSLHMAYGPNVVRNGRRYGNAILSRLAVHQSRNYDLSVDGREPRGALRCDLTLDGGRFLHVFCLHLGLRVRERRKQESLLLSADILRDAVRQEPVIVCGDFNYWGFGLPPLVRHALRDAGDCVDAHDGTYPSALPFLRLDRIYVDPGVRPLSLRAHRTALSRQASDHLPLVMRFEAPVDEGPPISAASPVEMIS